MQRGPQQPPWRNPDQHLHPRLACVATRSDRAHVPTAIRSERPCRVFSTNPDPLAQGPIFAFFLEPPLNDRGDIVFTADLLADPTVFNLTTGVFTGPDLVADKVLQAGDTIEGVPVTSVSTRNEAMNNVGEIVMTVQSQNPDTFKVRTLVVTATPTH